MSGDGYNFAAVSTGRKRSGKSHLTEQIGKRFPRRIITDHIGEFEGAIAGAVNVYSVAEAVDTLRKLRNQQRWTLLCIMQPDAVIELVSVIAPHGKRPESSFTHAVGGVTFEDGEIDLVAPNNQAISKDMLNLWARGRHYRVNPLVATTRPRMMHRIITSQSDVVFAFKQTEPADRVYLGELMRGDVTALLRKLPYRHYLRWRVESETLEMVNGETGAATLIPDPYDDDDKNEEAMAVGDVLHDSGGQGNSDGVSDVAKREKTARGKRNK